MRNSNRLDASGAVRVGLYGALGGGNSGNEASMASMLTYLGEQCPTAVVDAMCGSFDYIREKHGIATVPLMIYERYVPSRSKIGDVAIKVCSKFLDPVRIYLWVGRHDVVLVPGVGILETTLPVRAYGFPLAMTTLAIVGKIRRVPVALISVGADQIGARAIRFLQNTTARLAAYRSYRDQYSMDVMRQRGVSVADDHVFPDLAFSIPTPPYDRGDSQLIGVGVMDYHGGNDDRDRAVEIYADYLDKMTSFVQRLLDNGYNVRLFGGDAKVDYRVAEDLMARIEQQAEPYPDGRISVQRSSTYSELLENLNLCGAVVGTRYHNVVAALKLSKPTIAIGYSRKFGALMDTMGMSDYTEYVSELDVDRLIFKFKEIETRRAELSAELLRRNAANSESQAQQFAVLSARFFQRPRATR